VSSARIRSITLALQRTAFKLDLHTPPAALEHLAAIEEHVKALTAALTDVTGPTLLEGRELWSSLATAVVSLAREKRALRVDAADLKDLVENHAPAAHLRYWTAKAAAGVVGLLRYQDEVRALIEAEGVIYWDCHEDDEFRIVNTRHLTAHADIRQWVLAPPTGARCRFCGGDSNPEVDELHAADETFLRGVERRNGKVVVPAVGALTHDKCAPFWREWVGVAAKYGSQEEAVAADLAAGRRPRVQPGTVLAMSEAGA
jgi:hypothetical protein